jgi:O-antigen/teichoic acid export membrane protein
MRWSGSRGDDHSMGRRTGIVWGIADQSLSSVTNLALAVLAGRWLGPRDLGVLAIGFSSYVITLVLLRALVTDPAIVLAGGRAERREASTNPSITITIAAGAGVALGLGILGWRLGGAIGDGLLVFAPWIVPALLQDFWRFALFSSGRRGGAVLNDGLWFATMCATLPLAWRSGELWAVVGSWGLGATVASLLGFLQMRAIPGRLGASVRWWRREAASLGKWLAVESAFLALGSHGAVFLLALLIGPAEVGGLRAVQSIFAPLTLIGPAIALPGLPALASALRQSLGKARAMATRFSLVASFLAGLYMAGFLVAPGRLLGLVYGHSFSKFANLVIPVAAAQMAHAAAAGHILLLKGARRVQALALARAVGTVIGLLLAGFLAGRHGVVGAAWGLACGVLVSTLLIMVGSWRVASGRPPTDSLASDPVLSVPTATGVALGDRGNLGQL